MASTLFADISEFQGYVDDSYPHQFLSFRSNDGTYRDLKFSHNLAWAKSAVASGKLVGFIVYFVWEPNWQATVDTFKSVVGTPHPKMAVMMDVESWNGRIRGNQSAGINAARESTIAWLGGNRARVVGYGNTGDLNSLWPQRGDVNLIIAAYNSNPSFTNKIAHQFSAAYPCAPFGTSDMNSADNLTADQFAAKLGLTGGVVHPIPPITPIPEEDDDMKQYVLFQQANAIYESDGMTYRHISSTKVVAGIQSFLKARGGDYAVHKTAQPLEVYGVSISNAPSPAQLAPYTGTETEFPDVEYGADL